jgi:hypothetical protein
MFYLDRFVVDENLSGVRADGSRNNFRESAFSSPVFADQGVHFAGRQIERRAA